jgi:hypothetical protein
MIVIFHQDETAAISAGVENGKVMRWVWCGSEINVKLIEITTRFAPQFPEKKEAK